MGKHDYMGNSNNEYEELYVKYTLAMRKLEAELKNLVDAYKFSNPNDDIVDHTKSRIKSFDSAVKKLQKRELDVTPENMENCLCDMVGFRIVCPFTEDVYKMVDLIKTCEAFGIEKENDYIVEPKKSGYTSYHIDVSIPIRFKGDITYVFAEIQIRTMAMDLWATLDHKLRYKLSEGIQEELSPEFLARAKDMSRFDYRMQCLKDEIVEMRNDESVEKPKKMVKKR